MLSTLAHLKHYKRGWRNDSCNLPLQLRYFKFLKDAVLQVHCLIQSLVVSKTRTQSLPWPELGGVKV